VSDIIKATVFVIFLSTVAVLSLPWAVIGLKSYNAWVQSVFEKDTTNDAR
jgi:hypothetical protein